MLVYWLSGSEIVMKIEIAVQNNLKSRIIK